MTGKRKKQQPILAEPQVLRQWDDAWLRSIQILSQGINIHLHLMALKVFLVVRDLPSEQDIKQWDVVTFETAGSLRGYQKKKCISARKEYMLYG